MEPKFGIILILLLSILFCKATEDDKLQAQESTNIQTIFPSRDALIQQQTDAISRIVQAKSLEIQQNASLTDSILLTRCQQLAQRRNYFKDIEATDPKNASHGKTDNNKTIREEINQTETKPEHINNKLLLWNDKINDGPKRDQSKLPEILNQEGMEYQTESSQLQPSQLQSQPTQSQLSQSLQAKPTQLQSSKIKPSQVQPSQSPQTQPQTSQPQIISSPYGKTFYYIYHQIFPDTNENNEQKSDTTTTVTTSTSTAISTNTASSDHKYTEKMRFVMRMPYPKAEHISNFPWEFDSYAYYPKEMQPDFINVPMPYFPTYHMIRRLIVPSKVPGSFVVETDP